jgi:hypothetical protein
LTLLKCIIPNKNNVCTSISPKNSRFRKVILGGLKKQHVEEEPQQQRGGDDEE